MSEEIVKAEYRLTLAYSFLSKSNWWLSWRSDILGRPVVISDLKEFGIVLGINPTCKVILTPDGKIDFYFF